jgi:Zn-dependent protease
LAAANIFLVLFNMIPAFPMDGGRVLRALLAMKLGQQRATRIAATIGQVLAFGLVSACSAIRSCCSSRSSSTWRLSARPR